MAILYKLSAFEGPLDLLLHLIEKNKVNIYDIPISEITEQYLQYVSLMDHEDLNVISDFLVMAATLIEIKSKLLLPVEKKEEDGEEVDPRAELVLRLLEYKKYKAMALKLSDMEDDAELSLFKEPSVPKEVLKYEAPIDLDKMLDGITLAKLQSIFEAVMKRKENRRDPIRSNFSTIVREPISLEDKICSVLFYARKHRKFSFRQMLMKQTDKMEVVVTFLAILELMKLGKIHLTQEKTFADMYIETVEPEELEEQGN